MKFSEETVSVVFEEGMDLLFQHYKEVSAFQDIALEPDIKQYHAAEAAGAIKTFTVREEGELVGYAAFFIQSNAHYKSSLQAVQDVIFIRKDKRGHGYKFIDYCDQQLKEHGCQVVYHHVKFSHDWSPMLERLGYQAVDKVLARRLD